MDGKAQNGETLIVTIDAHCPSVSKHTEDNEQQLSEECLAVLAQGMQDNHACTGAAAGLDA